jgi:hypothetical protein
VLRDHALGVEPAGSSVALDVLGEVDSSRGLGEQPAEPCLAFLERPRPPVLAVELEIARSLGGRHAGNRDGNDANGGGGESFEAPT